jgi:hypothetical protein
MTQLADFMARQKEQLEALDGSTAAKVPIEVAL